MRTPRKAIVLGVSVAAHLALLAVWMSARPDPIEPPAVQVQLVRLPPRTPPPTPKPPERRPSPSIGAPRPALEIRQSPPQTPSPSPVTPAPVEISPEWRVKPGGGADLEAAPFVLGRAGLKRARSPRATCKTHGWDRPIDCPADDAELAASKSDAAKDSKTSGFSAEGARKLTLKTYRESPSTSDFPGIRCSIFHKCKP